MITSRTTGRRGRPSKLTPELTARLCAYLRDGHYIATACQLAGITEATYHAWAAKGRATPGSVFSEFLESMEAARAHAEADALSAIRSAMQPWRRRVTSSARGDRYLQETDMPGDWRAAAWYLERAYPERYGRGRALEGNATVHVKRILLS